MALLLQKKNQVHVRKDENVPSIVYFPFSSEKKIFCFLLFQRDKKVSLAKNYINIFVYKNINRTFLDGLSNNALTVLAQGACAES